MTDEELLTMLKLNLEIATQDGARNGYLSQLIEAGKRELEREGVTLTDSIDDNNLIVMYASYLYRQRAVPGEKNSYVTSAFSAKGMPRMLRYAINNRLMAERMGT